VAVALGVGVGFEVAVEVAVGFEVGVVVCDFLEADADGDAAGAADTVLADGEGCVGSDVDCEAVGSAAAGVSAGGALVGSVELMGGGPPRLEELSAGPAAIAMEPSAPE